MSTYSRGNTKILLPKTVEEFIMYRNALNMKEAIEKYTDDIELDDDDKIEIVLQGSRDIKYAIAPCVTKIGGVQAEIEQLRRYINTYGPVTIYDMMYFFKWSKSKCLKYICEIDYRELSMQGKEFYYTDKQYGDINIENDAIVFSGFDPFVIGYEKKNSIIIKPQNIRDIYLLQGVICLTLFWKNRIVGVWWKTRNIVNIKFFEKLSCEIKVKFFELLDNVLNDKKTEYNVIEY